MPARMHSFYLRRMYQQNDLVKPPGDKGAIELDGTPIDLRKVKLPTYILSTREDHIAPWKSTYRATQIYGGKVRFVLAASGHIAGVVNPPEAGKYSHWVGEDLPADSDAWFKGATELSGSWWPDWQRWVVGQDKATVPARVPGDGGLRPLADAPGTYVMVQARD
jgi:polyhydroxyalkanoate synthase